MDRIQLKTWLDEELSLDQIGALTSRHPSTVSYWLKRHGLRANGRGRHAPKGGLRKGVLAEMVAAGMTLEAMARELDRSVRTVRYWMAKYEIKGRGGWRRERALAAADRGERELIAFCRHHGETPFMLLGNGRTRCRKCNSAAVAKRRRRVKKILVEEAGGCCVLCGYGRHPAALHFHHLDPGEKEHGVAEAGVTRSLARARAEAAKCVLLCGNCHAEVEAGLARLPREGDRVASANPR